MTEAEIDVEFERTAYIANAINALAQAELAVAAVDHAAAPWIPDRRTLLDFEE